MEHPQVACNNWLMYCIAYQDKSQETSLGCLYHCSVQWSAAVSEHSSWKGGTCTKMECINHLYLKTKFHYSENANYSGRRPQVKVCRAVLFVHVAIVRPRGIWKREHVIIWRLHHHHLNTLFVNLLRGCWVSWCLMFLCFWCKFALASGFLVLPSCLRPEWRLQIASC